MGFFQSKNKFTCYLDLSPGSCGIALVEDSKSSKGVPKVITTRRIPLSDTSHPENQLRSLKRAADELLSTCMKEFEIKSYALVLLIHSPYCGTSIFDQEKKFEKETLITPGVISSVHESFSKKKGIPDELHVIHEYAQTIFLNGYPTKKPVGKYAHMVSVKIIEDTVTEDFYQALIAPLIAGVKDVKLVGYSQLVGRMLASEANSGMHEFTFMSIGKMHTEIATYSESTMRDIFSLHLGTYTLVEILAEAKKIPRESAETLLRLHTNNNANAEGDDSITESAHAAKKLFDDELLKILPTGTHLPATTYFVQDSEWGKAVSKMFENGSGENTYSAPIQSNIDQTYLQFSPTMDARLIYGINAVLTFNDVQDLLT